MDSDHSPLGLCSYKPPKCSIITVLLEHTVVKLTNPYWSGRQTTRFVTVKKTREPTVRSCCCCCCSWVVSGSRAKGPHPAQRAMYRKALRGKKEVDVVRGEIPRGRKKKEARIR